MSIKTRVCVVILLVKNQIFFTSSSYIGHPLLFDQRLYISLCLYGVLCEFILWMEQAVKENEDARKSQCDWSIFPVYVYSFFHMLVVFESQWRNLNDMHNRTFLAWML